MGHHSLVENPPMVGCSKVNYLIDWDAFPLADVMNSMTPMTDTLHGGFGEYAKLYEKLGSNAEEQARLFDNWYVLAGQHLWHPGHLDRFDPTGYLENTAKNIAEPLKPLIRFYLLKARQALKPHVDFKTKSCINFVYNRHFSPITVEGVDYGYGQFLLDNTKKHGVKACSEDRFILSFSFEESYDEVKRRLEKNGVL